ncbi:MAG TPA: hypothetical protein VF487_05235 [Chitinophagaceae bacterium]
MKKRYGLFVLILMATQLQAQHEKKSTGSGNYFTTQVFAGLLEGENGSSFQVQTINGIKHKSWFAGLGTGLDYYLYRSVPLFISVNKSFKPGTNSFFIQGDGGLNFAWIEKEINRFNDVISDKFSPHLYWNGAIGFASGKKNALMVSLGYSYKRLEEIKERAMFCTNPPCSPMVENYNYRLRRVSLRVGWQFSAY